MLNNKELTEESMLAQQVYLDIVRSRHLQWASSIDDPAIQQMHVEIADLLLKVRNQYYDLLNANRQQTGDWALDIS